MRRVSINCDDPDWQLRLHLNLSQKLEIDLINADFSKNGTYFKSLAQSFSMELLPSRDPSLRVVHFRKAPAGELRRKPAAD